MYVFDTGPLIDLFKHYYPERFPSLWSKFESLVTGDKIISVREVLNEISRYGDADRLFKWAQENRDFFLQPSPEELTTVTEIFKIEHFQTLIRNRERLKGNPVADPFLVAKAKAINGSVVTTERHKKNSAKLPNVCEAFEVKWMSLEDFMDREGWTF